MRLHTRDLAPLGHVEFWVFDLDNTLYPPAARLFDQIEARMADFVTEALGVDRDTAHQLRRDYWARYGTTLAGLMAEHDIDPEPFLAAVHDIDLGQLQTDPDLAASINRLPGRKIVYTNGSRGHATGVLAARGLTSAFDAVYGIEHAQYEPKPAKSAFEAIFARDGIAPEKAAMFEDDPRNLAAPHAMGMATIHVAEEQIDAAHIHHWTDDLTAFLSQIA